MKKDGGVAAVLNTLIPGLGWIYCEEIAIGLISIIIDVILWIVSIGFFIENGNPFFCFVYIVYCFIQINAVCYFVNKKTIVNQSVDSKTELLEKMTIKTNKKSFWDNLRE